MIGEGTLWIGVQGTFQFGDLRTYSIGADIIEVYEAEYGLAAEEQSCLNFLMFIHADRRSKFTPFGVFSDERYHLVDGNDRIVEGLVAELPGQVR